jgi:hypothetical protein
MPIFTMTSEYTNAAALQKSPITINRKVFTVNAVRCTVEAEVRFHAFLTSALDGGV